jgi:hypothetical protein
VAKRKKATFKLLVKEIFRMIRAATAEDVESDSEDDESDRMPH